MHSVFTYGTLQVPLVMQAVTGKEFPSTSAVLNGYQRFKIKDRTYPGLIKNENNKIEGTLYNNIDDVSLQLLDEFEDICYDRCLVSVICDEKQQDAFIYITKEEYQYTLSKQEWSLEEFENKYLNKYLNAIFNY